MALPEWVDLDGRLARLQERPVVLQFRPVDLCPCLDQTLLRLRQAAAQTLDGVEGKDRCVLLVEGMKVRAAVLNASFHEHADDDSEEARDFRHSTTLPSSERTAPHLPVLCGSVSLSPDHCA